MIKFNLPAPPFGNADIPLGKIRLKPRLICGIITAKARDNYA